MCRSVTPVNTTRYVLEQEGLYEGEQIRQQPTEALSKLFGADSILYVTIHRWDAQYALITTTVTVQFEYTLVSKDGTKIWAADQRMQYTPQNNGGGSALAMLVTAVVNAAVARAAPNYMPLTRQANTLVFNQERTAIPLGPYRTPTPVR